MFFVAAQVAALHAAGVVTAGKARSINSPHRRRF
jgi:hypothetical protein